MSGRVADCGESGRDDSDGDEEGGDEGCGGEGGGHVYGGIGGAEADGRRRGGEGEVEEAVRCRTRPGPPRGVGRRAAGRRRAAPLTVEDREVEVPPSSRERVAQHAWGSNPSRAVACLAVETMDAMESSLDLKDTPERTRRAQEG